MWLPALVGAAVAVAAVGATQDSDPAFPPELIVGPCSLPSAKGWKMTAAGQLMQGSQCAACSNPPSNGGFAYMAACGGDTPWQTWSFNKTRWASSAPNASLSIMLPAEPGASDDYGFTYDKNADRANMKPGFNSSASVTPDQPPTTHTAHLHAHLHGT